MPKRVFSLRPTHLRNSQRLLQKFSAIARWRKNSARAAAKSRCRNFPSDEPRDSSIGRLFDRTMLISSFPRLPRQLIILLALGILFVLPICGACAQELEITQAANPPPVEKEEHLPLYAVPLFRIGPLPVTNSMVVTWIVAIAIIVFARIAMRNVQTVPSGAQNFCEWLVESLYTFLEGV